jgi:hypothetical protein
VQSTVEPSVPTAAGSAESTRRARDRDHRDDGTSETGARRVARRWLPLLALFAVTYVVFHQSPVTNPFGDSELTMPTAASLVHTHDLTVDEYTTPHVATHYANREIGGHRYNYFPWTVSLFAVPQVVVTDALGAIEGEPQTDALIDADELPRLELTAAALVCALAAVVVAVMAQERLRSGSTRTRRWLGVAVGAVFAFGTSMWSIASRSLWQHGPSVLCGAVALLLATRLAADDPDGTSWARPAMRRAAELGAVLALGYTVRPTNAVPALLVAGWLGLRHRRALVPFALGGAAVMVPWFVVNQASYGELLPPYHAGSRFSFHGAYLQAVAANLFSTGRGLFVFSPVAVLAVIGFILSIRSTRPIRRATTDRGDGLEWVCAAVVVLSLLVVSGLSERWWAGHTYGPRFMSDTLPYLALLALPAVDRLGALAWSGGGAAKAALAGTALAVAVSVVVHWQGATLYTTACWNGAPLNVDVHPSRVWSMGDPQVTRGVRVIIENRSYSVAASPYCPQYESETQPIAPRG